MALYDCFLEKNPYPLRGTIVVSSLGREPVTIENIRTTEGEYELVETR